ncbi:endodeoxyribonuclease RusA [Ruminococcus sp. CAG:563]|nr:endodeoxyribonuclease RusA [Ruminococcus sp. CAG:563]
MIKEYAFFVPMIIPTVTDQEKKIKVVNGKPRIYKPTQLKDAKQKFLAYLGEYKPEEPLHGAVQLVTKWCFPITGKHYNGEYKTTRPDTDNLIKLLKDVMTELSFWKDDAQVASEITEKFYSDVPGLFISIKGDI